MTLSNQSMKKVLRFLFKTLVTTITFSIYVGCSNVKFSRDEGRCSQQGMNCVVQNDKFTFDEVYAVGGGKVDILIVDDNSASMSFEQRHLAERFNQFIKRLEERNVDYRIAITTTDISNNVANGTSYNEPRSINSNGALQDGNLIAFSTGAKFLTSISKPGQPASATDINNQSSLFAQAVERPETRVCEQFIADWVEAHSNSASSIESLAYQQQYQQKCPSGDERGIFAATLVLEKNPENFIRPGAHLAIIFLSDENEKSLSSSSQSLQAYDRASSLIDKFNSKYGNLKTLLIHALVAKDNACVNQQSSQTLISSRNQPVSGTTGLVKGFLGLEYLAAAAATGGVQGDICAIGSNYTTQLGDINTKTEEQISEIRLACENATDLQVVVRGNDSQSVTWTVNGNTLQLNQKLPAGVAIDLHYTCDDI